MSSWGIRFFGVDKRGSLSTTEEKEGSTTEGSQREESRDCVLRHPIYETAIRGVAEGSGMTTYGWRQTECWPKGPEGTIGGIKSTKSEA